VQHWLICHSSLSRTAVKIWSNLLLSPRDETYVVSITDGRTSTKHNEMLKSYGLTGTKDSIDIDFYCP
jgi:hypothetical protein